MTHTYRTYPVGHWLGIRANDDSLALAEKSGVLLTGKNGHIIAYDAKTGRERWRTDKGGAQPVIIRNDTFVNQNGRIFDTATGERRNGKALFQRGGCNYAVANENLILLRDYCVSYVDVATDRQHSLRNVRSGCSNSLVAANGVLSVPCFSMRCVCNYPIQTSFAMVHLPAAGKWAGATALKLR